MSEKPCIDLEMLECKILEGLKNKSTFLEKKDELMKILEDLKLHEYDWS